MITSVAPFLYKCPTHHSMVASSRNYQTARRVHRNRSPPFAAHPAVQIPHGLVFTLNWTWIWFSLLLMSQSQVSIKDEGDVNCPGSHKKSFNTGNNRTGSLDLGAEQKTMNPIRLLTKQTGLLHGHNRVLTSTTVCSRAQPYAHMHNQVCSQAEHVLVCR